ncbi:hypothetical protein KM472_gp177 [Cynomolgus macaque cytomegalovirus strain Ottawa]|uniref:Uncharacterized protein n=1 Tax=macacine betaherpesvirus 8 TaxID=2560567 RepID=G8H0Q6_9BETA|nr:hypothetical protein KM472_gp177 [Cynomolgus macaque cytomegalovirus strain Ottawa]AEQ32254.1 hypothetical protein cy166 [Cynomolgus macaque cytomegalovirus strain Ottawa]
MVLAMAISQYGYRPIWTYANMDYCLYIGYNQYWPIAILANGHIGLWPLY